MLTHSLIRACTQDPRGGLVDKPGKSRDFYHTCYALSGLSVAQHSPGQEEEPILVGGEVNLLVSRISEVNTKLIGEHPIGVAAAYSYCVTTAGVVVGKHIFTTNGCCCSYLDVLGLTICGLQQHSNKPEKPVALS